MLLEATLVLTDVLTNLSNLPLLERLLILPLMTTYCARPSEHGAAFLFKSVHLERTSLTTAN